MICFFMSFISRGCQCFVSLPRRAMGWSVVCDCGIFCSPNLLVYICAMQFMESPTGASKTAFLKIICHKARCNLGELNCLWARLDQRRNFKVLQ